VQEIALVLVAVLRAQQSPPAVDLRDAGVMSGGDALGAEVRGGGEEMLELDLAIAQHVRVRCTPGGVLGEEMREHPVPVFAGEIPEVDRQSQAPADRHRIATVVLCPAVAAAVVGPVLHEESGERFAGVAQQQRRDGGIDAARHPHDGPRHAHVACLSIDSGWRCPAR
jgi:hypothetical protein